MDKISIELKDGKTSYQPGEKIRGELEWELAQEVPDITINIFWYTEGIGDQDSEVATTEVIKAPLQNDRQSFEIELPMAPYSYSGQISALKWAIEATAMKGKIKDVKEFSMTPGNREIILPEVKEGLSRARKFFERLRSDNR
jgi:hypothetical protein